MPFRSSALTAPGSSSNITINGSGSNSYSSSLSSIRSSSDGYKHQPRVRLRNY